MQKTSLTPFFETSEKSIQRILKQPAKSLYEIFNRNMDIALQKLGANAFTKTVRKLLSDDKISLGYSATSITSNIPVYSIYIGDEHMFAGIVVDIIKCSPDTGKDILKSIMKIEKNSKEIISLQKMLTDSAIEKTVRLKKENENIQIEIASMLDYPRIAEAIYFSFIRYIVAKVDKGSSAKMFEEAIDLFKKIIMDAFGNMMNISDQKIFNAALEYIFTVSFTNLSPRDVLYNLEKRYGSELVDTLKNVNITKIDSIDKITLLLSSIKVLNTTPIAFNNTISKKFGVNVLTMLYGTYDYYISWATLTVHHSILFNSGPIDKTIQQEIEKIVLNYKSRVSF